MLVGRGGGLKERRRLHFKASIVASFLMVAALIFEKPQDCGRKGIMNTNYVVFVFFIVEKNNQ